MKNFIVRPTTHLSPNVLCFYSRLSGQSSGVDIWSSLYYRHPWSPFVTSTLHRLSLDETSISTVNPNSADSQFTFTVQPVTSFLRSQFLSQISISIFTNSVVVYITSISTNGPTLVGSFVILTLVFVGTM